MSQSDYKKGPQKKNGAEEVYDASLDGGLSLSPRALELSDAKNRELIRSPILKKHDYFPKNDFPATASPSIPGITQEDDGLDAADVQSQVPSSLKLVTENRVWKLRTTPSRWSIWRHGLVGILILIFSLVIIREQFPQETDKIYRNIVISYLRLTENYRLLRVRNHEKLQAEFKQRDSQNKLIPGTEASSLLALDKMDCSFLFQEVIARTKVKPLTTEGRVALANCYLFYDNPVKALSSLKPNENSNGETAWTVDRENEFILFLYLNQKSGETKANWRKKALQLCEKNQNAHWCLASLIQGGDGQSAEARERQFQMVGANIKELGPLVESIYWIIGGKIALEKKQAQEGLRRFSKSLKILPAHLVGLKKEVYELKMLANYWVHDNRTAVKIVADAKSDIGAIRPSSMHELESLFQLQTGSLKGKVAELMNRGSLKPMTEAERMLFPVICHEAIRSGLFPALLRYMQQLEKPSVANSEAMRLEIQTWRVRAYLGMKDGNNAYREIRKLEGLQGETAVTTHFKALALLLVSETQQYDLLAIKELQKSLHFKNSWETLYVLGRTFLRVGKTQMVPPVLDSLASFREDVRAKPWIALLKIEYMINRGQIDPALSLLEKYLAKRPRSLTAYRLKMKALEKAGKRDLYLETNGNISRLGLERTIWSLPEAKDDPYSPFVFMP